MSPDTHLRILRCIFNFDIRSTLTITEERRRQKDNKVSRRLSRSFRGSEVKEDRNSCYLLSSG